MKREVVETRLPKLGPYSQVIRAGDLVFTAGQAGIVPATGEIAGTDFEAQARQALANLRAALEDAGSSLFGEFFPSSPPVRSVPVVALPRNLLFSVDAIAVVRGQPAQGA